ncbi:MAG: prolipoprotein diacylglyceryl transferase [Bacteroidota bacterium]
MNLLSVTWEVSPVIFSLGPISVRWYGLFWALSFYIGYELLATIFKKENVGQKELDSLLIHIAIGSVLGARLGHCFFYDFDYYIANPIEVLYIWQGGLASHGGAIGILLAMLRFYKRKSSKSFFWTVDRMLIPVALAAFFIRMGNMMNHEIYGYETSLPWGFKFIDNLYAWMEGAEPVFTSPRHPTGIYEGIGYLFVFFSMLWMYFKKMPRLYEGFLTGYFLITLFTWRFLVEYLKEVQSAFEENLPINMGQILSIPMVLMGIGILVYAFKNKKPAM